MLIGKCDVCKKDIVTLIEVRKKDNIPFVNNLSGQKAIKVKTREKKRIDYTISSLNQQNSGWVYGVNVGTKIKMMVLLKFDNMLLILTASVKLLNGL